MFITREQQLEAILVHLTPTHRRLVLVGWHTGWRKRELLTLEWRNIDRKNGVIRLDPQRSKNREGRLFPYAVLPELKTAIDEQWTATQEEQQRLGKVIPSVFHHRAGKPIRTFTVQWNKACRLAGYPGRHLHDLRRSTARRYDHARVPRSMAMKLCGCKTDAMYRRYVITETDDLTDGLKKVLDADGTPSGTPGVQSKDHAHLQSA